MAGAVWAPAAGSDALTHPGGAVARLADNLVLILVRRN